MVTTEAGCTHPIGMLTCIRIGFCETNISRINTIQFSALLFFINHRVVSSVLLNIRIVIITSSFDGDVPFLWSYRKQIPPTGNLSDNRVIFLQDDQNKVTAPCFDLNCTL